MGESTDAEQPLIVDDRLGRNLLFNRTDSRHRALWIWFRNGILLRCLRREQGKREHSSAGYE